MSDARSSGIVLSQMTGQLFFARPHLRIKIPCIVSLRIPYLQDGSPVVRIVLEEPSDSMLWFDLKLNEPCMIINPLGVDEAIVGLARSWVERNRDVLSEIYDGDFALARSVLGIELPTSAHGDIDLSLLGAPESERDFLVIRAVQSRFKEKSSEVSLRRISGSHLERFVENRERARIIGRHLRRYALGVDKDRPNIRF